MSRAAWVVRLAEHIARNERDNAWNMPKLSEFLGMDSPALQPGFTVNERAGRMPVCTTCGALVAYETQELHLRWHSSPDAGRHQPEH